MTCVAKKSPCGKFYIVNGTKKWITNGTFCDYFVTAVRTGEKGIGGISMLLIERSEGTLLNYINFQRTLDQINQNKLLSSSRYSLHYF